MAVTREIAQREQTQRTFEAFARRLAADPDSLLHKMIVIQAAHAERSDTHQAPGALTDAITNALETEVAREYTNPTCRGSLGLGNACRRCERCLDELKALEGFGSAVGTVSEPDPSGDTPIQTLAPKVAGEFKAGTLWVDGSTDEPATYTQTLPVAGYKNEQPAWVIELVNINKILEEAVMRQLDHIKVKYGADVDQRQLALARTATENAFYHSNRALYQPQRILEGPSSDKADAILRAAGSNAALSVEQLRERSQ